MSIGKQEQLNIQIWRQTLVGIPPLPLISTLTLASFLDSLSFGSRKLRCVRSISVHNELPQTVTLNKHSLSHSFCRSESRGSPLLGSLKTGIKVLTSLRPPLEALREKVLPSSFRCWQTQLLAAVCLRSPCSCWLLGLTSLGSWKVPSAPGHVASPTGPSQHDSSLLQGQQESLSPCLLK